MLSTMLIMYQISSTEILHIFASIGLWLLNYANLLHTFHHIPLLLCHCPSIFSLVCLSSSAQFHIFLSHPLFPILCKCPYLRSLLYSEVPSNNDSTSNLLFSTVLKTSERKWQATYWYLINGTSGQGSKAWQKILALQINGLRYKLTYYHERSPDCWNSKYCSVVKKT
jgi:hypothetical protein